MKGWRLLHRGSDAFWVGAVPTGWPRDPWWTDLSTNWIVDTPRAGRLSHRPAPDEVLYAPPATPATEPFRRREIARWAEQGARTVVQVEAHLPQRDELPFEPSLLVWDPTFALLHNTLPELPGSPPGCWVVWPLVRGVSDAPAQVYEAAQALADRGVAGMVPVAPALSPRSRRLVVERYGEDVFEALHHGGPARVGPAAAAVARAGLDFQPPRPPRSSESEVHSLAAQTLGWLGDLDLRLGHDERGQRILRAQRWLETAPWDLETIARDGHLELVPELSGESGEVVGELLESGRSARLEAARSAYLGQAESDE